ncbi:glycosyltransferase involved in cell wall biosynthesis [Nakamurella sp. UYEF19]|uniref:hypothetical protein n=1 Tax=Nakamurella sp. UYEF19 TaxID=1756392 RepID=UPI003397ED09
MNDDVVMVTCGPADHGIVRFGRQLHAAAVGLGFTGGVLHEDDPRRLLHVVDDLPSTARVVHLQANDWLFSDPDQTAAQRIAAFADALRSRGTKLALTLHDLPHPQVSRELFLRRARDYLTMTSHADAVAVSSKHERLLIGEAAQALREAGEAVDLTPGRSGITVIPLPVASSIREPRVARSEDPDPPTLGVLGFLYPGKGHREILEEMAHFGAPITLVAIGGPSRGHETLLSELIDRSSELGLAFRCTGFVPDAELDDHLQGATVPIAAAPAVSASASINTWIAAGRRPLVVSSRYSRELDERMPGSVVLYEPGQLRSMVESVLTGTTSTRLPVAFRPHPDTDEVARRYLRWLGAAGSPEFGRGGGGH